MARVPIEYANPRAFDRLIKVMRAQLGTELSTVGAAINGALDATAPTEGAYYRTFSAKAQEIVRNHGVVVLLWQQGPSRFARHNTSGSQVRKSIRMIDVDVLVVFSYSMASSVPTDAEGYGLTPEQEIFERANIYNAAVISCLYKYAPDFATGGSSIHKIEMAGDDWELVYDDEFLAAGVAQTTWTITQTVEIPTCRPLP